MKKKTYRFLSKIPIVDIVVKTHYDGSYRLLGSLAREAAANGEDDGWLEFVNHYLREHPDEYPTNQLIDRLTAEHSKLKK